MTWVNKGRVDANPRGRIAGYQEESTVRRKGGKMGTRECGVNDILICECWNLDYRVKVFLIYL